MISKSWRLAWSFTTSLSRTSSRTFSSTTEVLHEATRVASKARVNVTSRSSLATINDERKPLSAYKADTLKEVALACGIASSGTKAELVERLGTELLLARFGASHSPTSDAAQHGRGAGQKCRILSIDMGIRNLAYAVLDVHLPLKTGQPGESLTSLLSTKRQALAPTQVSLSTWSRLSLTPSSFDPPTLAIIAHDLVTKHFLAGKPSIILIERQRHRSGGGAAVLEWTLRVNMLESLLWGVLTSLKPDGCDLRAVSPQMVGSFWTAREQIGGIKPRGAEEAKKAQSKSKQQKALKIAVAEEWLRASGSQSRTASDLASVGQAAKTKAMFLDVLGNRGKRRKSTQKELQTSGNDSKLDDLADCLLQGTAWVEWEINRLKVLEIHNGNI